MLPWRSRAAAPLPSLPVLVVLILSAPILALPAPRPLTPALTLVVVVVTGVPVLTVVVARVPVFPVVVAWVSVVSVIPGFPVSRRGKNDYYCGYLLKIRTLKHEILNSGIPDD